MIWSIIIFGVVWLLACAIIKWIDEMREDLDE